MWQKNKPYILILPAILIISILFFCGIFQGFLESIGLTSIQGVGHFSIDAYIEVLISEEFWSSFGSTLRISVIASLISGLVGILVIFCLFIIRSGKNPKRALIFQRLFQIPMLFPYLVGAYLIFLMFTQSGWISRILFNMGIIHNMSDFPILINDEFGWGIIIAYVWKTSPFVVLMLYPVILKIESSWLEVGRVFGANRMRFFKEIVFPLLISPLRTSWFIIFAYIFSAFEIPFLLGVTYPKTVSVYSYQMYTNGTLAERPKALAINIMVTMFIGMVGLFIHMGRKRERRD